MRNILEGEQELVEDWVVQRKNLITGYDIYNNKRGKKWIVEERKYYIPTTPYNKV